MSFDFNSLVQKYNKVRLKLLKFSENVRLINKFNYFELMYSQMLSLEEVTTRKVHCDNELGEGAGLDPAILEKSKDWDASSEVSDAIRRFRTADHVRECDGGLSEIGQNAKKDDIL